MAPVVNTAIPRLDESNGLLQLPLTSILISRGRGGFNLFDRRKKADRRRTGAFDQVLKHEEIQSRHLDAGSPIGKWWLLQFNSASTSSA